ncbi:MAG: group III truncated hemoglobin [Gordonia sp. (in: high G+C Gram-positive bacteria)]|uniref:group III truncated hemoglobin n=1 Tax=Gordonia sp. (in: high G+C Gram-positive bacteria) TaxID=84139 RepID=UPI003BB51BEF
MSGSALGDLADRSDVVELLGDFYNRAFHDELLQPVFVDAAQMDLAAHLPAITDFWCKAVLKEGEYRRNVFEPHRELHELIALEPRLFERWLALWHNTIDDRHAGSHADLAKLQGARIALSMCRMLTGERVESIAAWLAAHSPPSRCRSVDARRLPRDP